eukprot:421729_1
MPLQGFWNFIIFARPNMERIREEYPDLSFLTRLRKMIFTPHEVRSRPSRRIRRGSLTTRTRASNDVAMPVELPIQEEGVDEEVKMEV